MPINPNPVNWFEIPASDLARSKRFYESVFGVELAENEMGPSHLRRFDGVCDRRAGHLGIRKNTQTYSAVGTVIGAGWLCSVSRSKIRLCTRQCRRRRQQGN